MTRISPVFSIHDKCASYISSFFTNMFAKGIQMQKKMQHKKKLCTTITMVLLIATAILTIPVTSGAGAITLSPTSQAQGSSVTVAGTGFTASQSIAIVLGPEITVTNETHPITNTTGTGPFTTYTNHGSIKPGS